MPSASGHGRAQLARRVQRQPKKVVVVVVDGRRTERDYFDDCRAELKGAAIALTVKLATEGCVSRNAAFAMRQLEQLPAGSEVWYVYDCDTLAEDRRAAAALARASSRGLRSAPSMPCFEVWYLAHFQCTHRAFGTCASVISRLKKHLPGYDKSGGTHYASLRARLSTAVANARAGRAAHGGDPFRPETSDSSTCVDELMVALGLG